jgi:hypothetical protein
VDALECDRKRLPHLAERQRQRRAPADHDVIMTRVQGAGRREFHDLAQASAHTVAFHRIADLLGHGETDARWTVRSRAGLARPRLHHECRPGRSRPARGRKKIRPAFQTLDGDGGNCPSLTH